MRPRTAPLIAALILLSCDGVVRGGQDIGPGGDLAPRPDGPSAKHDGQAKLDGTSPGKDLGPIKKDSAKPDPCKPLPAGCLCPAACATATGACDNSKCPCQAIAGVNYTARPTSNPSSKDPAKHGDVNLLLRKKRTVAATKSLITVSGPTDSKAPQLFSLFVDDRVPGFPNVYQVEHWDWGCDCPKGWLTKPQVTLAGMGTKAGEVIRTPTSGYDIGAGHTAMVLYAAPNTITLKYTVEDNVVYGYTIHLSGICVEPKLQALYNQCHAGGRKQLPVLKGKQPLGRALGGEIQAAIRDTGSWMDPRAKKDWWQGK